MLFLFSHKLKKVKFLRERKKIIKLPIVMITNSQNELIILFENLTWFCIYKNQKNIFTRGSQSYRRFSCILQEVLKPKRLDDFMKISKKRPSRLLNPNLDLSNTQPVWYRYYKINLSGYKINEAIYWNSLAETVQLWNLNLILFVTMTLRNDPSLL